MEDAVLSLSGGKHWTVADGLLAHRAPDGSILYSWRERVTALQSIEGWRIWCLGQTVRPHPTLIEHLSSFEIVDGQELAMEWLARIQDVQTLWQELGEAYVRARYSDARVTLWDSIACGNCVGGTQKVVHRLFPEGFTTVSALLDMPIRDWQQDRRDACAWAIALERAG